ncbi:transglutaminase family protein [Anditalea andensis]|uniref:Transglutaminase-like domain-containing protein n=1 Tax=Anditalea andensis TaxID=1048983 RepID=A0A074L2L1_9BACT|nr:transglutaminase family protein [Anditalea andensis]KEO74700.1 hypothetical protein EL17_03220 [Anditalea andensis]
MLLNITHITNYTYSESVPLNPHSIYLYPLPRKHAKLLNFDLQVTPTPVDVQQRFSIENNPYYLAWFIGEHASLSIEVSLQLAITPFNPFSFVIDPDFMKSYSAGTNFQNLYKPEEMKLLSPSLTLEEGLNFGDFVTKLHKEHPDPINFLVAITESIHSQWKHIIREEENLWSPDKTFLANEGSCRDLSWMLMQMLRKVGLGTKFVSGYAFNPELDEGNDLHAWVEVYLPGAGWVGIDPSLGLLTDEHYIPLASSAIPQFTLPVSGTYGGTASSEMHTEVVISEV